MGAETNPAGSSTGGSGYNPAGSGGGGSGSSPNSEIPQEICPVDPIISYKLNPDQKNKKKKRVGKIDYEIRNKGTFNEEYVVRIIRDDMPVFIGESQARKKIYHAPDFGIKLPESFDVNYAEQLEPKARMEYVRKTLPPKYVYDFMKAMAEHVAAAETNVIKMGTLGGNGHSKDWEKGPMPGKHFFNPKDGNDLFFADDNGFNYHTGWTLNEDQIRDLLNNNNIL